MKAASTTEADDLALALTLAVTLGLAIRFVDYAYDDAFITYRYARNLVDGHGFVYNVGQDVLGTTTPLYTLLLAGLGSLVDIPTASGVLSLTSLLGCIFCVEMLGRREGLRFAGPLTASALIANPELYQIFGGETVLVHLLLVPAGLLLHRSGRTSAAAVVFGLAILGRMDAGLFVALVYAGDAVFRRQIRWREALIVAMTLAPWAVYGTWAFGQPLPSTLAAKIAQGESGAWPLFFEGAGRYLGRLVEYEGSARYVFWPLLALGLARVATVERGWLVFVVGSALFALAYQLVLGASFSHWYLAPIFLANALLLGAGLRALPAIGRHVARRGSEVAQRRWQRAATVLLASIALADVAIGSQRLLRFDVDPPRRRIYTEVGRWLAANTPADASVAYFEIGYLGYFSRRTIIDPVGLVTPGGLAHVERGELLWIFDAYEPDYYVHNPALAWNAFVASPWFRARYRAVQRFGQDGFRGSLVVYRRNAPPAS